MKVTAILNNGAPVKAGQGKNGPWEMVEVELDSGDTASLFSPVNIGQEVETYEHEKYGLQYRKKRTVPGMEGVDKIKDALEEVHKLVRWLVTQEQNRQAGTGYDRAKATAERISRAKVEPFNERPTPPVEHFEPDVSETDFDPAELNGLDL